jgi:hypothetical protein
MCYPTGPGSQVSKFRERQVERYIATNTTVIDKGPIVKPWKTWFGETMASVFRSEKPVKPPSIVNNANRVSTRLD